MECIVKGRILAPRKQSALARYEGSCTRGATAAGPSTCCTWKTPTGGRARASALGKERACREEKRRSEQEDEEQ